MAVNRAEVYHNLSSMLASGLPVQNALRMAAASCGGVLGRAFREVAEEVLEGEPLAAGMQSRPDVFPALEVLIMEAAETSGRLPESLERLSQYYAFRDRIRKIMVGGLVLPISLLHVAALVIPLPPFVLGKIGLASYIIQVALPLLFLYIPAGLIFALVKFTPDTGPARLMLDGLVLNLPILGAAVRQLSLSRFARTFQMLYATGNVPMAECMRRSVNVAGNSVVRRWLVGGIASAEAGHPVSEGFTRGLPADFAEIWRIGEESGKVGDTALRLADNAAEESERRFQRVATWLPRIAYALVSIYIIVYIFKGVFSYLGTMQDALDGTL